MFPSFSGRIRQLYQAGALLIVARQLLQSSAPTQLPSVVVDQRQHPFSFAAAELHPPGPAYLPVPSSQLSNETTLHVLYGLSGNIPEFFEEFVVSLKSVLLNAPLDNAMEIHLIVDAKAHRELTHRVFPRLRLKGSRWRNPVAIYLYPVSEPMKASFGQSVKASLPLTEADNVTIGPRVGPGGLFRLFAHEILPQPGVETVLYLDNDVVVFANLAEILQIQNSSYMYQIGVNKDDCSGLMILNLNKFATFFDYLKLVEPRKLLPKSRKVGDQLMLHRVKELLRNAANEHRLLRRREKRQLLRRNATEKERNRALTLSERQENATQSVSAMLDLHNVSSLPLIGDLPLEWHVHLAHGYRRKTQWLRRERPNGFAMLHFNGKRANEETWWSGKGGVYKYCAEAEDCAAKRGHQRAFRETWNLAEYYVHLPFEHALYLGKSMVGRDGGSPLVIQTRCPASNPARCRVAES